jgi:hypothetical protein
MSHNKEECYDDLCLICAEVEEIDFQRFPEQGLEWYGSYMDDWNSLGDEE